MCFVEPFICSCVHVCHFLRVCWRVCAESSQRARLAGRQGYSSLSHSLASACGASSSLHFSPKLGPVTLIRPSSPPSFRVVFYKTDLSLSMCMKPRAAVALCSCFTSSSIVPWLFEQEVCMHLFSPPSHWEHLINQYILSCKLSVKHSLLSAGLRVDEQT